jgi:hypothetical protein
MMPRSRIGWDEEEKIKTPLPREAAPGGSRR